MRKLKKVVWANFIAVLCLVGCGHEHAYVEATCTEPRKCTVCGETEGEALGHVYEEATCEKARTCSRCGAEEGNKLGHSVEIGTCARCGTFVNQELYNEIKSELKSADAEISLCLTMFSTDMTSRDEIYKSFVAGQEYVNSAAEDLRDAREKCVSRNGLEEVKDVIESALEKKPKEVSSADKESLNVYLDEFTQFMLEIANAQIKILLIE